MSDLAVQAALLKAEHHDLLTPPRPQWSEQAERVVEAIEAARVRLQGDRDVPAGQMTLDLHDV